MTSNKQFLVSLVCVLLIALSVSSVSAKDEWLRVRSKNFNLIGNASEKNIRKVATRLEQFRETFQQLFTHANFNSTIPVNVIVFKNTASFDPYKPLGSDGKPSKFVGGYFLNDDVNYIALSTEGEDYTTFALIFHEYVHFIIHTNLGKYNVPAWFDEGLAQYYSTFSIEGDQTVKLGLPIDMNLDLLHGYKLIPLDAFFNTSNSVLKQNGDHLRSIFYAEAWVLVHYLIQSGKTDQLGKFLTFCMQRVPAEKAFQDAFETTYPQMERNLKNYVAQNNYKYQTLSFKNKLVFEDEMQVSHLTDSEKDFYLNDLLIRSRNSH